jgi:aspartate 1-decarboxylase
MFITTLKAKIHRARVTGVHADYEGSCAIDQALLDAAGLLEFEQIHLYNVSNGERLVTYAIPAPSGSGTISLNGAAAHKAETGDLIIIAAYAVLSAAEAGSFRPTLVYVDAANHLLRVGSAIGRRETRA